MKRPVLMLVAGMLMAGTAWAQEHPDTVIEKSSKRAYPVHLMAGPTGQTHTLTGIGVRTKTFLNVKVYAVGLYVDAAAAREALEDWAAKSPKELEKDKSLYARLLDMDIGMTLRLVMTRNVGGETMANAFDEALAPRVEKAAAEMNMPGGMEALAKFRSYFGLDKVTDGSILQFSCVDGTLYSNIKGEEAEPIESPALCWALFDVYLGEKPISKGAKKKMGRGFAEILAHSDSDMEQAPAVDHDEDADHDEGADKDNDQDQDQDAGDPDGGR